MKIKSFIAILVIFAFIAALSGCARPETYGERITNRSVASVKDILLNPKDYIGKTVTVKGRIMIECETGCWFNFKEGNSIIYVDLEPSGFAIPQKGGHDATVEGNVVIKEGKTILVGKGVEVR